MIEVYSWATPNGHKVHILLEEMGLPYKAIPVDIGGGDQFTPSFLKFSPNNKIPAIIDPNGPNGEPYSVFESGAILVYLASKTGQFLGETATEKFDVLQWLMFQMGGVGPMLGQNHHFRIYAPEKLEYAVNRYTNEAKRLYGVMDQRLGESQFIAGNSYTIADMAIWPWLRNWKAQGMNLGEYDNLTRWMREVGERPAVQRGILVLANLRRDLATDQKAKETLFGPAQYAKR